MLALNWIFSPGTYPVLSSQASAMIRFKPERGFETDCRNGNCCELNQLTENNTGKWFTNYYQSSHVFAEVDNGIDRERHLADEIKFEKRTSLDDCFNVVPDVARFSFVGTGNLVRKGKFEREFQSTSRFFDIQNDIT